MPSSDPAPGARLQIVAMEEAHREGVLRVYAEGIATGNATFETEVPDWQNFLASRLAAHRWVALGPEGRALGWVACSAVSSRPVYSGVVEHSVYVSAAARGGGVGRALLAELVESTEAAGVWTIQSGIFPENAASLALHASLGFRRVGIREREGQQAGKWRDVVMVERRSDTV